MSLYPLLEVNLKLLEGNFNRIIDICNDNGISISGVIKGYNGLHDIVRLLERSDCRWIASSRIEQLQSLKENNIKKPRMLIRMPMQCEIEETISYCDVSLNSDRGTINLLNQEAMRQDTQHEVILMYDLGDLREGVFDRDEFLKLCVDVERLSNIKLLGIGTNLSCYGSVMPTAENLGELVRIGEDIEARINRRLDIISGGATTSLPLVHDKSMPERINHLRIGEGMSCAQDLKNIYGVDLEGVSNEAFLLKAQIIEANIKPTYPIGDLGVNAFGDKPIYEDRGNRRRAILAIGNQDLGNVDKLIPRDGSIEVLGGSSDHTIIDIHDCEYRYEVGDIIEFDLYYQAMLFATESPYVTKRFI